MTGVHTLVHSIASDRLGTVSKVEVGVLHEGDAIGMHSGGPSLSAIELRLLLRLSLEPSIHLGVTTLESVDIRHKFILSVSVLLSVSLVLVVEEFAGGGGSREGVVRSTDGHGVLNHLLLDLFALRQIDLRSLRVETRSCFGLSGAVIRTDNEVGVLAGTLLDVALSTGVSSMALSVMSVSSATASILSTHREVR
jgi:hypothetical protein